MEKHIMKYTYLYTYIYKWLKLEQNQKSLYD